MALGFGGGVNYHWQGVIIYRPLGFLWIFFTGDCQTCQASHRKLPYLDYDPVHSCPIRHLQKAGASINHPGTERLGYVIEILGCPVGS